MTFVMLGLVNVRRNLGRSVLAIVSMAVASLVVTSLLSLAPSAHTAEFLAQRFLFGGDIVVTGMQVINSAADLDPNGAPEGSWRVDRLPLDAAGLFGEAVPWPWTYGHLARSGSHGSQHAPGTTLSDADIEALEAVLSGHSRVAGIAPLSYMPALEQVADDVYVRSYLIGRDPARDAEWWGDALSDLLHAGRYLEVADSGNAAGNAPATPHPPDVTAVCDSSRGQRGYPILLAGNTVSLSVPRAGAGTAAGGDSQLPGGHVVAFDYADPVRVSASIAGVLRTVTAVELTDGGPVYSYWGTGALLVPQVSLDAIARQAGLARAPVAGIAVKARDLVHIDRLAAEIRAALPHAVAFSVRELERSLQYTGATTPLSGEMAGPQVEGSLVPRGLPLDLNFVFAVLAFTIAALIVAANLLVLLAERRREISILRSLGARTGDIALMVITEALVISLAGCVLGFWPIRLLATLTLVANRLSIGRIAALTFGDFGLVVGIALGLAALFGLLPAIASTRTTCMEALRND